MVSRVPGFSWRNGIDEKKNYPPVCSQCSCLVGADGGGIAHGLAGVEVSDQVVVCHHLLDGVGQGEGDGKGQTLGHSHHQHRDADDDELDVALEIVRFPFQALQRSRMSRKVNYKRGESIEPPGK